MSTAASFAPPRVTPNLRHAWGGTWRLTYRQLLQPGHALTMAIGLGVLTFLFAAGSHWGRPAEFLNWVCGFYVTFLVPALAFISAAGAMRDAMKSNSIDYVLTRPLPKPAFVVFKFLAHLLCAQINFLVAFGVVVGFVSAHQVPGAGTVLAELFFGQVLMVTAFSAFGFLAGAITSRYVIIGLGYAGVIEAGVGQIPTQISQLSMSNLVRNTLTPLLQNVASTNAPSVPWATAVVLLFTLVMVGAAVAVFTLREQSGPAES
jgi:ABC-2 type transport system permease protein